MDAQKFLPEFKHFSDAAGGVTRLRALIIDLAIKGELLSNDRDEEPARILLSDIKKHRSELVETGKIRRATPLPAIDATENPFTLPRNWEFARLGEICDVVRGVTFSASNKRTVAGSGTVACLRTSNIQSEIDWSNLIFIDQNLVGRDDQWLMPGDIMISMANSYELVGKVALAREIKEKATFGGFIAAIRPYLIEPEYLYILLSSRYMQAQMRSTASQTTNIANISLGGMRPIPIPIPPKQEQSRIVEKVQELLAICDRLEHQQHKRRRLQNTLRKSTLKAVSNAQSPHELEASWKRLDGAFSHISSAPEDVDDFIVELKSLAVRGLLVSSSSLRPDLDRIKEALTTQKDSYIAKRLMRKQKTVGMAERDTLYPDHWAVTAFDDVAIVIGGVTKGRNLRDRKTITCPYLAVANVQRGYVKLEQLKTIEITTEEFEKYVVMEGDLLITEGGDWDKVGRTAIWRGEIENCLHQNHIFKVRVPSELLLNEWTELVLNSGVGRDYFAGASKQTTNLASINMTQLRSFPIPIPPLDEQKRILETLSSLNELCEDWRSLLQSRQELSASFANAAVTSLTGIATDQREEAPLKAPQTELIAPLRLHTTPDVSAQAPLTTILARHNGELPARDLWQRFGGEIDAFYAQLKTEVAYGWIAEPAVAEMLERPAEAAEA